MTDGGSGERESAASADVCTRAAAAAGGPRPGPAPGDGQVRGTAAPGAATGLPSDNEIRRGDFLWR